MTRNASRSRAWWLLALFAAVGVLFLVAAAACGGDDDGDNGSGNEPTADSAGDDGGDDGGDDLSALTGDYEEFEGYVRYTARDFPADEVLNSMAIYQEGDKSRADIDSGGGLVTIIDTPEVSYVCSENKCVKGPAGGTGAGGLFTSFIDPATIEERFGDADYDVSEDEIAGIEATCFKAGGNEVCFAEGGLLLRITFAATNGGGTLEAVEANTEIPDDAFEPPFDVIDLEDLGQ